MRVSIVGSGRIDRHPPSRALARQLDAAGHRVDLGRARRGPGRRPDLVYPATRGDVALAADLAGRSTVAVAPPAWGLPADADIAWRAPAEPRWSTAPAGPGLPTHLAPSEPGPIPATDRHRGRRIAVAARHTPTSPARYLVAALERAGVDVVATDRLDWSALPTDVDAVVVVESPLPPLPVSGTPGRVPVLFWAHHGEHHTATQLRLIRRYRANAVLLAHSWHLAHRFPIPVHRFPFGIPVELVDGSRPWADRTHDAAMVGAGLDGGGAYAARGALVAELRQRLGEGFVARSGIAPEDLAALYADTRVVPNEGGTRHRPVTMRVFEAIGSGALLVTDDAPGLDRLFVSGEDLVVAGGDLAAAVVAAVADPRSPGVAAAGLARGLGAHTTDHRVDGLFDVLATVDPRVVAPSTRRPDNPVLGAVWDDPLLDDVVVLGLDEPETALSELVVWDESRLDRYDGMPLTHAVAIGPGWAGDVDLAVRCARRLVVAPAVRRDVAEAVHRHHPEVVASTTDGTTTFDLGVPGYRLVPR